MKGEFIEADVASISAQSVRIGTEGENARAIVEFDVADLEVFGEACVFAVFEDGNFPIFDAVGKDRFL